MVLEKFLKELADGAKPPKYADLLKLSGLAPEELEPFRRVWSATLPVELKRDILARLVELSEENVDADFAAVFRHCLADPDQGVREKAVLGLWECDDRTLIAPLIDLLCHDASEAVRAAAAMTLGKFAYLAETGKILARDGARICEALVGVIERNNESLEVRRRALEAVGYFSSPKVSELVRGAYESGHAKLRHSAVYAMGRNCDPQWLPVILQELRSQDPLMRYEAASACREMGEEDAVPHLVPLTQDEDSQVQLAAITALGVIGGGLAKKALLRCARSPDDVVREAAEVALEAAEMEDGPVAFKFNV
ncbi:MAG: HEAT repeat domain-containing protein [Chloroflexi bacterium]|nr:HEAT repeat domain-containing protein [Chloroflexota bacterium]